jgi:hypothetical protein
MYYLHLSSASVFSKEYSLALVIIIIRLPEHRNEAYGRHAATIRDV